MNTNINIQFLNLNWLKFYYEFNKKLSTNVGKRERAEKKSKNITRLI